MTKVGWLDVLKAQLIFRDIIADVKRVLEVGSNCSLLPFFLGFVWTSSFIVVGMLCSLV